MNGAAAGDTHGCGASHRCMDLYLLCACRTPVLYLGQPSPEHTTMEMLGGRVRRARCGDSGHHRLGLQRAAAGDSVSLPFACTRSADRIANRSGQRARHCQVLTRDGAIKICRPQSAELRLTPGKLVDRTKGYVRALLESPAAR